MVDKAVGGGARESETIGRLHHSLMNPLTVVVGYAQLLAARRDLDEDVRNQATRILEEARECVRIIERYRHAGGGEGKAEASLASGSAGPARRRVLVVDDEPVILKLSSEVLGSEHDVVGAADADEAVRRLLTEDFDVVLLDLNLGGRIGGRRLYETLLVQQPEVAERVVFVTGGVISEEEQDFINGSGRECIQKPFHIRVLRDIVSRGAGE